MTNFTVSLITTDSADNLKFGDEEPYQSKLTAFAAAKRLAGKKAKFTKYGPNSVAYVGQNGTAVVAW